MSNSRCFLIIRILFFQLWERELQRDSWLFFFFLNRSFILLYPITDWKERASFFSAVFLKKYMCRNPVDILDPTNAFVLQRSHWRKERRYENRGKPTVLSAAATTLNALWWVNQITLCETHGACEETPACPKEETTKF